MKRSLLVGLSLSFVLFTMAASITSTVAWFSSTRVAYTSAGNYGIKQPDGNLDAVVAAGVGTKLSVDGKSVLVQHNTAGKLNRLLDASYNPFTNTAYRLDSEGVHKYKSYGSPDSTRWKIATTNDEIGDDVIETDNYCAVTWTITFSYIFRDETKDVGVFLNLGQSELNASLTPLKPKSDPSSSLESAKGFRIAFVPDTFTGASSVDQPTILGKNDEIDPDELKYVTGLDNGDTATYESKKYVTIPSDGVYTMRPNGDADNLDAPERICTLTKTNDSVDVTCVAWFEGEDPNVVEGTQMDVIDALLSFYVRSDA